MIQRTATADNEVGISMYGGTGRQQKRQVEMTKGSETRTPWRRVQGRHFKQSLKGRNALVKQSGRSRGGIDILYEFLSSSVGISVIATSNLDWILSRISISVAFETKVKARPLVPKRPARLY